MTYIDEPEVRRPSRGTKVLAFGSGILAVLGSFWGIVWFIRTYVEPPRVMRPSPLALASRDSTPVSLPEPKRLEPTVTGSTSASPSTQDTAPAPSAAPASPEKPAAASGIADRWASVDQFAPSAVVAVAPPPPAPAVSQPADPAPTVSTATSLATAPEPDVIEEVAEGSVPAISGPAPLPRRRPAMTTVAAAKRNLDPPLPRPRPDGPAPQSVWTAVPVSDDRFPTQ